MPHIWKLGKIAEVWSSVSKLEIQIIYYLFPIESEVFNLPFREIHKGCHTKGGGRVMVIL